jgi:LacI family transcriptional regulator
MASTLKDIGRDLGLSVVTVSKVLRNYPDISEQTKQSVLKRMKELKYQPNYAARALITGRTSTMGLIVPYLLHPFFANIANAMSAEIRRHGYGMLIASCDEESEIEQQEILQLLASRVDVMINASAQSGTENRNSHRSVTVLDGRNLRNLYRNRAIGCVLEGPSRCASMSIWTASFFNRFLAGRHI